MKKEHKNGFVALASVLILSAIFLSITISITGRAITRLDSGIAFLERDEARYLSEACIEKAMMEVQRSLVYEEGEVILLDDASCQVVAITGSGNERLVQAQSTVGSHTYRIESAIAEISPSMSASFNRVNEF
jgi:hypothetical protein